MFGSLKKSCVLAGRNLLPDFIKCPVELTGVCVKNQTFRFNRISNSCQHFFHTTTQNNKKLTSKQLGTARYVASKEDKEQFEALFNDLVKDITDSGEYQDIPNTNKKLAKSLLYNVTGGKNNRGIALYNSYRMLVPESEITEESKRLVMTMGWCVEMFQAFMLVLDDIIDGSEMRRGKPCWHQVDNFGNFAINDGVLIECGIYEILHRHFRDKPYYPNVVDHFHKMTLKTMMGQSLDTAVPTEAGNQSLEHFTIELYTAIVKYKTCYYTCYYPVAIPMTMTGIKDPELYRKAESILLDIGHLFQVQDDFLDLYGSFELTGKKGTDIQNRKCSWLAVVALERANQAQRRIMDECYGSWDPKKVDAVRQLYETLGLRTVYATYEEETYNRIKSRIQEISGDLPAEMFLGIMDMFYKRLG